MPILESISSDMKKRRKVTFSLFIVVILLAVFSCFFFFGVIEKSQTNPYRLPCQIFKAFQLMKYIMAVLTQLCLRNLNHQFFGYYRTRCSAGLGVLGLSWLILFVRLLNSRFGFFRMSLLQTTSKSCHFLFQLFLNAFLAKTTCLFDLTVSNSTSFAIIILSLHEICIKEGQSTTVNYGEASN